MDPQKKSRPPVLNEFYLDVMPSCLLRECVASSHRLMAQQSGDSNYFSVSGPKRNN